jgi:hypothetical protein
VLSLHFAAQDSDAPVEMTAAKQDEHDNRGTCADFP